MELKNYQKRVLGDLQTYLAQLQSTDSLSEAFRGYWLEKQVPVGLDGLAPYQNLIEGVPHVCYKVPTGGGKTLLACASIKPIMAALPMRHAKVAVWLVPSESILTQTLRALKNPAHPYRQRLNVDFGGRVEVYSKEELLAGQNFSPVTITEQLSIMVLSYDSFRSANKEGRKAYQANGALEPFRNKLTQSDTPIENADETALFQVINSLNPVVIVDESHHARSKLSLEMLKNFNPAFVLDLTATPTKSSNIISYVDAMALKKENMVKLPVVVYNRNNQTEVINDAIDLRNSLEQAALTEQQNGGDYIRPIVLFQAQPKNKEDATSFERLKDKLVEAGIEASHIAIKTATINELKNVDLLSPNCPIRYIITVNALKEGWDCPFAYILASLANKTSRVDVEQILGRILRQPHVRKHQQNLLNMSYVLASSANFQQTVDDIVVGLNAAGFSAKDYRLAEELAPSEPQQVRQPVIPKASEMNQNDTEVATGAQEESEEFLWFDPRGIKVKPEEGVESSAVETLSVSDMIQRAQAVEHSYAREADKIAADETVTHVPQEVEKHMKQYRILPEFKEFAQNLKIPQFFYHQSGTLFEGSEDLSWALLTPENLGEGFSLKGKDSTIIISRAAEDMVAVDVRSESSDQPKAFNMNIAQQQELLRYIESLPEERRIEQAAEIVFSKLDRLNTISSADLKRYVQMVVYNLDASELKMLETVPFTVAEQIKKKVQGFLTEHRARRFSQLLETGEVKAQGSYTLPEYISPVHSSNTIGGSLYEAEGDMNAEERDLIMRIAALDNVVWWHRISERASEAFCINGPFNHYPDFMVCTQKGKIVLVESKGEMLKNDDSRLKIELGKQWAHAAGPDYRYYMVFKDGVEPLKDAHNASDFLELLTKL